MNLFFFQISSNLERNGGQKYSTGQRFIFTEATFYKIYIKCPRQVLKATGTPETSRNVERSKKLGVSM